MLPILALLVFAHQTIQPAKPGTDQPAGQYVISPEGVFKIEKGKVLKAPKKFHPAFLFSSDDRFKIAIKPAEPGGVTILNSNANTTEVRYSDGFIVRKGTATTLTAIHQIESAHAIVIAPGGDEYLLIRWQGDSSSCKLGFTLFKLDNDTLKEAATNAYDCDL
jgi:hypothetical protein